MGKQHLEAYFAMIMAAFALGFLSAWGIVLSYRQNFGRCSTVFDLHGHEDIQRL